MYLTDDAMLWWRRMYGDVTEGCCTIATWEDFRKEIKSQFFPKNVEYLAWKDLKRLKHTGSIREYVEQELQRRGVQDLATTLSTTEKFVEFTKKADGPNKDKKGKPNQGKGEGDKPKYQKEEGKKTSYDKKGKGKFIPRRSGCFICDSDHRAFECPKKKALNALLVNMEGHEEKEPKMGALRLLNAMKGQAYVVKPVAHSVKDLMYIDVCLNGKNTRAMIDTGATHNFISGEEAKRLGLKLEKDVSKMKAVNSEAKPVIGVARSIACKAGECLAKAIPMPCLGVLSFLDEKAPCMVPMLKDGKKVSKMLSAMQLVKGLKKGEVTYLATLSEERDGTPMFPEVEKVLSEFKDVMPPELPKRLPPRREVNHQIELEPGSRPPALAPYRMSPPELEELRRQLRELMDAGFIRPSKALVEPQYCSRRSKMGALGCASTTGHSTRLAEARFYSKLDLRSGYYQVRVGEGDEPKTTCVTSVLLHSQILLKKNVSWQWTEQCKKALEDLKGVVTVEPVLKLADHSKSFEDGHPVAYESRKLNETEQKYTVQEEMMAVVADVLSRKAELAAIKLEHVATVSKFNETLPDHIREGLSKDDVARGIIQAIEDGRTRRF
ncbi:uncharacterized protein [Aristolochia californica]|uniref:uncharacterized protein n=1 Tax=Aristolochia californica TaxID=171875 RepID=UPI0035DBA950